MKVANSGGRENPGCVIGIYRHLNPFAWCLATQNLRHVIVNTLDIPRVNGLEHNIGSTL
jgi:hypothetical protein